MGHGNRFNDLMKLLVEYPQGLKVRQAAERLGINVRSVYRLRDRALEQGFDLESTPGILKLKSEQSHQITLNAKDALRLHWVTRGMPSSTRHVLLRKHAAACAPVYADTLASQRKIDAHPKMSAILSATTSEYQIDVFYETPEKIISGTALSAVQDRHLYLLLNCEGEIRTLRADRILEIRKNNQNAIRGQFDLDAHLNCGWGPWGWGKEKEHITLRISQQASKAVARTLRHREQHMINEQDGCLTLELHIHPCREFLGWIMSYMGEIEVISPLPLRQKMHEQAKKITQLHSF
mgnify:FL=1